MVAVVALVHGEPGAYGISYPDFQGCVSGGKTVDEALRRGREGLAFHVESMTEEGEPLPRVRDVAEIKADPEFADDIKDAIVALVELELPGRAVRLNISIEESLLERIDRAAEGLGESRSGFLAEAAKRRLAGETAEISLRGQPSREVSAGRFRKHSYAGGATATRARKSSRKKA